VVVEGRQSGESSGSPSPFTLTLFFGAVLIGGANFLAVRFSNEELDPFWGAGLRFSLAGAIFVITALVMRLKWPRRHHLLLVSVYGFFTFTLSYALAYWALTQVTASLATVVFAVVPLVTPLLAAAQRLEALNVRNVVGAVGALLGMLWMTVSAEGLLLPLGGLVAMLLASVTVAQSAILGKRVSGYHPVMSNAVGMAVGAPLLLVISAIAGEVWAVPTQPKVVWSVAYLVVLGSVGLFVAFIFVYRGWTASAATYAFVLFPVVTLVLETWLTDEVLTVRNVTGALIVMSAVWFGALAPRKAKPGDPETTTSAEAAS
jgi:drug/metabolite transporter (DMT)-like permease